MTRSVRSPKGAASSTNAAAWQAGKSPPSHAAAKFVSLGGGNTFTARTSAALSAASSATVASIGGATR